MYAVPNCNRFARTPTHRGSWKQSPAWPATFTTAARSAPGRTAMSIALASYHRGPTPGEVQLVSAKRGRMMGTTTGVLHSHWGRPNQPHPWTLRLSLNAVYRAPRRLCGSPPTPGVLLPQWIVPRGPPACGRPHHQVFPHLQVQPHPSAMSMRPPSNGVYRGPPTLFCRSPSPPAVLLPQQIVPRGPPACSRLHHQVLPHLHVQPHP